MFAAKDDIRDEPNPMITLGNWGNIVPCEKNGKLLLARQEMYTRKRISAKVEVRINHDDVKRPALTTMGCPLSYTLSG